MRYFYWEQRNGRRWPQLTSYNPKDRLGIKPHFVGEIHEITDPHITFQELVEKYPEPKA